MNENLSSDLTKATERLQETFNQLHELEAQKLIQTNQIAALETERLQLIGEKEEQRKTFDDGLHEKIRELGERYQHRYDSTVHYVTCPLSKYCLKMNLNIDCTDFFLNVSNPFYSFHISRELQGNLEQENHTLQLKCQDLEKKFQILEAEYKQKEEEHQHMRAEFERDKEELRKVAAHWNKRWLDVAMTLCLTQEVLDELRSQQRENDKVTFVFNIWSPFFGLI